MPYVEGRTVHDADSHVVETPDFFFPFADPAIRPRLQPLYVSTVKPGEEHFIEVLRRRHGDPAYRAREQEEILVRKNWSATGSFLKQDRPRALYVGVEGRRRGGAARVGNCRQMDHGILPPERDLQGLVVDDVGMHVAQIHNGGPRRLEVEDRDLAFPGESIDDEPAESARAAGAYDLVECHVHPRIRDCELTSDDVKY